MIIVDMNQVMLSNLLMQLGNHTNAQVEENMVRHMVLNSLRSYRQKFYEQFGELVIACDNTNVWRKKIFPYYKANRKKSQEKSELDWKSIFECMGKIRSELKQFFPYKVVDVETAEADDIIATLVKHNVEPILILSGDKDFIQLHSYHNVKQYDPVRKKWITHADPEKYLYEHILKGDSGDGVPNVLSGDDCFVTGTRQKPLTQKKIDSLQSASLMPSDILRNYMRNKQLIDLSQIPSELEQKILDTFQSQEEKGRDKLLPYFMANKLKNLTEHIGEF
jgi:5'-3' exonuclease, N-terminal resolvase-like domain/T4 RNase H, C terminal